MKTMKEKILNEIREQISIVEELIEETKKDRNMNLRFRGAMVELQFLKRKIERMEE